MTAIFRSLGRGDMRPTQRPRLSPLVYQGNDGNSLLWTPQHNDTSPLAGLAADPAVSFVSFGAFDPAIWQSIMVERHGFPPIRAERWIDLRASYRRILVTA
jgi:hypothetical protein